MKLTSPFLSGQLDLMVDCETLSTKPNAALLSIGAVKFSPLGEDVKIEGPAEFYVVISNTGPSQEYMYGRHVNQNTVEWWGKQSDEAREEVFENAEGVLYPVALFHFLDFVQEGSQPTNIWSFGSTADIVWLKTAIEYFGRQFPFEFRNECCLRTLVKLTGVQRPEISGLKHHALHDAKMQVMWAQQCFKELYSV